MGALGAVALTEGIKFLYGQVTELLKRRRDRSEKAAEAPVVPAEQPRVLDGPMAAKPVDLAVLDAHEGQLLELVGALGNYATGLVDPDPADRGLVERVSALRALLELAYGQHLTFRGEQRPVTGSPLPAEATAQVSSYVANVSASGAGAVAVGRDSHGNITTTTTHNPGPVAPGPGSSASSSAVG
jgi:hypothetical protein